MSRHSGCGVLERTAMMRTRVCPQVLWPPASWRYLHSLKMRTPAQSRPFPSAGRTRQLFPRMTSRRRHIKIQDCRPLSCRRPLSSPDVQLSPWADNYLIIETTNAYSVINSAAMTGGNATAGFAIYNFTTPVTTLSLLWGSPDSYNTIEFFAGADGIGTPLAAIDGTNGDFIHGK